MPFKDEEKFLRQTIDSILNQTFTGWELICIDDRSSDSSVEIVSSYALQYSQIKLFSNSGTGVISALQCGYRNSTGNFITRMDADDLMPQDKLQTLLDGLIQNGSGYISTGKVKYFNALGEGFIKYENWLNTLVDNQNHWKHIFKECVIASPNWMMSRSDFEHVGGFESEIYPEDYELVFRCFEKGMKVVSSSKVTHLWRDHEHRASRVSELYKENTFVQLKVDFFLKIVRNSKVKLHLWGAGKKGKSIAKLLVERGVEFNWLTNSPTKIGVDIYGTILQSDKEEGSETQWILAVSQPEELEEKITELEHSDLKLGTDYFVFV